MFWGDMWRIYRTGNGRCSRPKILNLMMVQEAVRHALQKGKTNIMFHTAETMQVAQFGAPVISEELVTEDELPANARRLSKRN